MASKVQRRHIGGCENCFKDIREKHSGNVTI